jgi:hypothetical protein
MDVTAHDRRYLPTGSDAGATMRDETVHDYLFEDLPVLELCRGFPRLDVEACERRVQVCSGSKIIRRLAV